MVEMTLAQYFTIIICLPLMGYIARYVKELGESDEKKD